MTLRSRLDTAETQALSRIDRESRDSLIGLLAVIDQGNDIYYWNYNKNAC